MVRSVCGSPHKKIWRRLREAKSLCSQLFRYDKGSWATQFELCDQREEDSSNSIWLVSVCLHRRFKCICSHKGCFHLFWVSGCITGTVTYRKQTVDIIRLLGLTIWCALTWLISQKHVLLKTRDGKFSQDLMSLFQMWTFPLKDVPYTF